MYKNGKVFLDDGIISSALDFYLSILFFTLPFDYKEFELKTKKIFSQGYKCDVDVDPTIIFDYLLREIIGLINILA